MKKLIIILLFVAGFIRTAHSQSDTTGAYLYGRMFIGKPATPYGGVYAKTGYFNALYLNNILMSALLAAKQDTNFILTNIKEYLDFKLDSTGVAGLIVSKQDASATLTAIDSLLGTKQPLDSVLTNILAYLSSKQDTASAVVWADTSVIAKKTFVTGYIDTSKVLYWADTTAISTRAYALSMKLDTTSLSNRINTKLNYNDTTLTKALYSTVIDITDNGDTGKDTIDARLSNNFTKDSIGVSKTITVNNLTDGQGLNITLGVTGNYTITFDFPGLTLKYSGGSTPTQTTTNGKIDVWTFIRHGLIVYGSAIQNF